MRYLTLLIMFALLSSGLSLGQQKTVVLLSKAALPDTGALYGMSNIFFDTLSSTEYKCSSDWKDVEIADLVTVDSFFPIKIIRYRNREDGLNYVVDTDGDSDFQHEKILLFRKQWDRSIADVTIKLKSKTNNHKAILTINYQILIAEKWNYSRISEYRKGVVKINGIIYNLLVITSSRNHPFYDLSPETIIKIDLNNDGNITERWGLTQQGGIIAPEEIDISEPFKINNKKLKVSSIDSLGSKLVFEETNLDTALAVGFKAPSFDMTALQGNIYTLASLKGKVILIEFWSPICAFCPLILSKINTIVDKYKSSAFIAIAPSGKSTSEEVKLYLKDHSYDAIVGVNSEAFLNKYNRQGVYPLFYVIDKNGYVRFAGPGANMVPIVDKMIEKLINSK